MDKILVEKEIKFIDLKNFPNSIPLNNFKDLLDVDFKNEYQDKFITFSYDDYQCNFTIYGKRLETDEEYQKRTDIIQKEKSKKDNRKKSQKDRDLSTIKTLLNKHKFKPEDLK